MNITRLSHCLAAPVLALAIGRFAIAADAEFPPKPTASELVTHVIAEEAKIDSLQSLYLRFEGKRTQSAEVIAFRLAERHAEFPNEKIDPVHEPSLWPEGTTEVEVAVDSHRVRSLIHSHNGWLDLRVFDGERAMRHQKHIGTDDDYYALDTAAESFDTYFGQLGWSKVGSHSFPFSKPEPPRQGRHQLNRRPQDYALAGMADVAGRKCYVLENGAAMRRLHIGMDDRRLHGLAELYLPTSPDVEPAIDRAAQRTFASDDQRVAWIEGLREDERLQFDARLDAELLPLMRPLHEFFLDDYRELSPGFWLPTAQTYVSHDHDKLGTDFRSQERLHLVDFKVNQPLADSQFTIEMQDGIQVNDWGHDPPLFYKQKADRTPEEWRQMIDQRVREEEVVQRGERARAALLGQPAPEFPAGAWVNSRPLTLAALRSKIVVLDFCSMSCGPCRGDFPTAQAAYKNAEETGIVVIGIHTDSAGQSEVAGFAKKNGLGYPILIDLPAQTDDGFGLLFTRLGVDSIPHSLLIDNEGKISAYGSLAEMLSAARQLKNKPSTMRSRP